MIDCTLAGGIKSIIMNCSFIVLLSFEIQSVIFPSTVPFAFEFGLISKCHLEIENVKTIQLCTVNTLTLP